MWNASGLARVAIPGVRARRRSGGCCPCVPAVELRQLSADDSSADGRLPIEASGEKPGLPLGVGAWGLLLGEGACGEDDGRVVGGALRVACRSVHPRVRRVPRRPNRPPADEERRGPVAARSARVKQWCARWSRCNVALRAQMCGTALRRPVGGASAVGGR